MLLSCHAVLCCAVLFSTKQDPTDPNISTALSYAPAHCNQHKHRHRHRSFTRQPQPRRPTHRATRTRRRTPRQLPAIRRGGPSHARGAHGRTIRIEPVLALPDLRLDVLLEELILRLRRAALDVAGRPVLAHEHPALQAVGAVAVVRAAADRLRVLPHELREVARGLGEARDVGAVGCAEIVQRALVAPRVHGRRHVHVATRQVLAVALRAVAVGPDAFGGVRGGVGGERGVPRNVGRVVLPAEEVGAVEQRGAQRQGVGVLGRGGRGGRGDVGCACGADDCDGCGGDGVGVDISDDVGVGGCVGAGGGEDEDEEEEGEEQGYGGGSGRVGEHFVGGR